MRCELLQDQLRAGEDLDGQAAEHEVELLVLQHQGGGVPQAEVGVADLELLGQAGGVLDGRQRVVHTHDEAGLQVPGDQQGHVPAAAADVGHPQAFAQAVPHQHLPFQGPQQAGLVAQQGDELGVLDDALALVEVAVEDLEADALAQGRQVGQGLLLPGHHLGADELDVQLAGPAGLLEESDDDPQAGGGEVAQLAEVQAHGPFQALVQLAQILPDGVQVVLVHGSQRALEVDLLVQGVVGDGVALPADAHPRISCSPTRARRTTEPSPESSCPDRRAW